MIMRSGLGARVTQTLCTFCLNQGGPDLPRNRFQFPATPGRAMAESLKVSSQYHTASASARLCFIPEAPDTHQLRNIPPVALKGFASDRESG